MGISINPRLALSRWIAFPIIRPTDSNEILGEDALIEGTHIGTGLN
jgi:hypothetical protein